MIDITADEALEQHCRLMVEEVIVGEESLTIQFRDWAKKTVSE